MSGRYANGAVGGFKSFVNEIDVVGAIKQSGRKLLDDFVNNNQPGSEDSNDLYRWIASKVQGTYEKPDSTSANGVVATVLVSAATLATPGGAEAKAVSGVKEITLFRRVHGEAAEHVADAIKAGKPDLLTIARTGAEANREASIGRLAKVPGKHLDEYPPAMFKEGGAGASVRAIDPRSNMSAGACIGNSCRGLPDGTRVRIRVED